MASFFALTRLILEKLLLEAMTAASKFGNQWMDHLHRPSNAPELYGVLVITKMTILWSDVKIKQSVVLRDLLKDKKQELTFPSLNLI